MRLSMIEKQIKDLKPGDVVELKEGGVATIVNIVRNHLIEVADGHAYDVRYRWEDGESAMFAVHGEDCVVTMGTPQ
jgi:uncharacterized protein YodC (DUF2158 family)